MKPSPRSNSRLSMSSKLGGGSRASDEDGSRTAVKVGKWDMLTCVKSPCCCWIQPRQYCPLVIFVVAKDITTNLHDGIAVRVRPSLEPTDPGYDLIPQRFQRSMVQTSSNTTLAIDAPQGKKVFVFDRVFSQDTTQEGVWEYLQESVESFLQGYNVSLLAYGQSGAGKSFTMGTAKPSEQDDLETIGEWSSMLAVSSVLSHI